MNSVSLKHQTVLGICFHAPLTCSRHKCIYFRLFTMACYCYTIMPRWKTCFCHTQFVLMIVNSLKPWELHSGDFLNPQSISCLRTWTKLAISCDFSPAHLLAPFSQVPLLLELWPQEICYKTVSPRNGCINKTETIAISTDMLTWKEKTTSAQA